MRMGIGKKALGRFRSISIKDKRSLEGYLEGKGPRLILELSLA